MDNDIARTVKVQGKTIGDCLESLRVHADKYGATYKATFGFNNKEFVVTPNKKQLKGEAIYIPFMWRHEYREYDNSS